MLGTFFKLVGKALRFSISRPIQRFNIEERAKKHLGEDAKYFKPAPRAIGPVSKIGPSEYPHLEGSGFTSIKQKRLRALAERNERLLKSSENKQSRPALEFAERKSFSETADDDRFVLEKLNKLPTIKTIASPSVRVQSDSVSEDGDDSSEKQLERRHARPLPKSTNLDLRDPSKIWSIDNVPPGRLSVEQFQELMLNKISDDEYWTPERIAEKYNMKAEYAEKLTKYYKQIRIVISPRMANALNYTARNNPIYQATKHILYHVDYRLRTEQDRQFDGMYLPTDQIDDEIRKMIEVGALIEREQTQKSLQRPEPLRIRPKNREISSQKLLGQSSEDRAQKSESNRQQGSSQDQHNTSIKPPD